MSPLRICRILCNLQKFLNVCNCLCTTFILPYFINKRMQVANHPFLSYWCSIDFCIFYVQTKLWAETLILMKDIQVLISQNCIDSNVVVGLILLISKKYHFWRLPPFYQSRADYLIVKLIHYTIIQYDVCYLKHSRSWTRRPKYCIVNTKHTNTVEPCYNEVLGTMNLPSGFSLYQG